MHYGWARIVAFALVMFADRLIAATLNGLPTTPSPAPVVLSGVQLANLDRDTRPQDDLFSYANGTWLRDVPIPPDRSRYGVDSLLLEHSLAQERALLEDARPAPDVSGAKARALYTSFMSEDRLERAGVAPLAAELKRIGAIKTASDAAALMGHLAALAISTPIDFYVQGDAKNAKRYALWLTQGGLGLPDRDYYLSDDARFADVRAKYKTHVSNMLRDGGDREADTHASDVISLEAAMAKLQWAAVERRDPEKTYNPMTLSGMHARAPQIDWQRYLSEGGVPATTPMLIIRQPSYVQGLSKLLVDVPIATWKAYFRFRLLSDSAPFMSQKFVDEDFSFNEGVLHDTPRIAERWKRGCALVDRLMGDALGKLYVERYFPSSSKARVDVLVANLFKTYANSIEHLDWLSLSTRNEALAKLKKIDVRVGYPAVWRDYSSLVVSGSDLLGNVFRARVFETKRQLAKLAHAVDRSEWEMTTPTVDAGYNPATNSIEFPAGVLQPPLYDAAIDDAYNYGSTGATIGHEISHAFDNRGSQYDGDGALRDWWTGDDHARFKAKTDKLVAEFDQFEPVAGFHVNGTLTLPENIADLAGLEIAYKAYLASLDGKPAPVIDGLTAAQRFFVGYAQSFKGKRREALLVAQLKGNPHSPERERVNGIVVHMGSFYEAFSVKPTDKMFLAPSDRVTLW